MNPSMASGWTACTTTGRWCPTTRRTSRAGRESARASACPASWTCPTATARARMLDVFPAGGFGTQGGAPVLVFIHGGYWRALDKSEHSFVAPAFTRHGACVVVPNYALCPAWSRFPTSRCRWSGAGLDLAQHRALRRRPRRITVAGHSAGGQLAAMMLACLWQQWIRRCRRTWCECAVDFRPVRPGAAAHAPFLKRRAASSRRSRSPRPARRCCRRRARARSTAWRGRRKRRVPAPEPADPGGLGRGAGAGVRALPPQPLQRAGCAGGADEPRTAAPAGAGFPLRELTSLARTLHGRGHCALKPCRRGVRVPCWVPYSFRGHLPAYISRCSPALSPPRIT
jgi:hypothetical protein